MPAVLGGRAGTKLRAFTHLCQVGNPDRQALAPVQHDVADLVDPGDLAGHAHQVLLAVALDVAGTHVLVVGGDRVDDVLQREAECDQL